MEGKYLIKSQKENTGYVYDMLRYDNVSTIVKYYNNIKTHVQFKV